MKQLQYKNAIISGYFIDENGKIYDSNGVEQEQYLCLSSPYYFFKGHKVHIMMAHSFYEYKEGYDVHHKNLIKTDNRLSNLMYLTQSEHRRLHTTGKKLSLETKQKISAANTGKKLSLETKQKISKKIFCLELNKVFNSIMQASIELNLHPENICKCCKGLRKTCGGFHFSYYSQDLNCHE